MSRCDVGYVVVSWPVISSVLVSADVVAGALWTCPAYVPVSELIYAAFRSNAKGLLPPSDE